MKDTLNNKLKKTARRAHNIAKYAPHKTYAVILLVAAVLIPSLAIFAYGPERPTYTIENPADHITFNSITNNPNWGDERNFVLVRDATSTSNNDWRDEVTVEPGKEYTVKMLVHNNAADNLNLVATNTRVNADVENNGTSTTIQGAVMADNASPQKIWDEVTLKSDKRFNAAIIGQPKYYNNVRNSNQPGVFDGQGGFDLQGLATAQGAPVGYQNMDGNLPGCFQYSGFVYFNVKIYGEVAPNFEVEKKVRKNGDTTWQKTVTVNPGEKVDYQISYKNTGDTVQNNVVAKDSLPAGVKYLDNTTTLRNASNPNGNGLAIDSNNLTKAEGINIGNYSAPADAYVRFTAQVADEKDLQCGRNVLRNTGYMYTENGNKDDYADVIVNKECVDKPSYSCDALQATKISTLEYKFDVKLSANLATAKQVYIDFGDGQNATRDAKSLPVSHTYTKAGQYTITAKASFDVNGKTVTDITSDTCKVVINTEAPTTPVGTTTTPTSLPSTGPVEIFSGILGVSALGLGIQQWIASRRAVASALNK